MDTRSGIVTLLTDFGEGVYVAAMKGAILSAAPRAVIVDVTHDIQPQSVRDAAFVLAAAAPAFPAGTVHCAVVDPGVGTARRVVLAEAGGQIFLAPDNGLLTLALDAPRSRGPAHAAAAWSLTNERFFRRPVSPTFHGRDILAPVAGAIAAGERLAALGPPLGLDDLARLPLPRPRKTRGAIAGEVIFADRFGNLITNMTAADLAALRRPNRSLRLVVSCAGRTIRGLSRTYGQGAEGATLALVGSLGFVEIAVAGGSAARELEAGPGTPVLFKIA